MFEGWKIADNERSMGSIGRKSDILVGMLIEQLAERCKGMQTTQWMREADHHISGSGKGQSIRLIGQSPCHRMPDMLELDILDQGPVVEVGRLEACILWMEFPRFKCKAF